ncbi:hypothetical protein BDN71DRAFT_631782 [Pleurotus eryngii]|uniref:Uncharacterized protein n=1 Tax=Pleurotus eryngii TaxID=5323 RepID=A0A9P5ZIX0_PLEER|nr:hypothetical protein BDN71DRAFT_631782 [Pleurotus eryngii]
MNFMAVLVHCLRSSAIRLNQRLIVKAAFLIIVHHSDQRFQKCEHQTFNSLSTSPSLHIPPISAVLYKRNPCYRFTLKSHIVCAFRSPQVVWRGRKTFVGFFQFFQEGNLQKEHDLHKISIFPCISLFGKFSTTFLERSGSRSSRTTCNNSSTKYTAAFVTKRPD